MRSTYSTNNAFSAAVTVLLLYSSCAGFLSVRASDPDPVVDVSPTANETFVFRDVFTNGDVTNTTGGTRAALNIALFPALTSEGITYVHFKMAPCGENLPHTHPRATKLLTMISGGPLQVGLVDTSGTPNIYILNAGHIMVFPRGLLHYELNVGTEEAFFVSALNSQNPEVLTAGGAFLMLPTRAAAAALNQDDNTVEVIKNSALTYRSSLALNAGCVPGQNITTFF